MYKAGCRRIHYGIESGVQKVIDKMRKQIKVEDAITAVNNAKKAGMSVLTYFMFGNLDETYSDMQETAKFSKSLNSDYTEFSITIPYAGTEMYEEALRSKIIDHDYWLEFALRPTPKQRRKFSAAGAVQGEYSTEDRARCARRERKERA